jgi:hypothetical protein
MLEVARRVPATGGVLAPTMKAGASEGFGELAAALEQAGFSRVTISPPATDER